MEFNFTLQELPQVAQKLIEAIDTKVLLFYGDMGVGKTTLIKELARQLGVTDTISSPTFSIINEYRLGNDALYHFDCYRLASEEEALDIGVEEYFESDQWCLVEWPEKN